MPETAGGRAKARSPAWNQSIYSHVKPIQSVTSEQLNRVAILGHWWRRFLTVTEVSDVHDIVTTLSPLQLASLDQRVRGWRNYAHYELNNWQHLRPSDVGRLARSPYSASLLGLASFHFNGHVREAAVSELALRTDATELPFLLIRLNDWVPQVRELAGNQQVVGPRGRILETGV